MSTSLAPAQPEEIELIMYKVWGQQEKQTDTGPYFADSDFLITFYLLTSILSFWAWGRKTLHWEDMAEMADNDNILNKGFGKISILK